MGAGATATGRRRTNEDAFLVAGPAFIVADGMGGHVAGAEAARAVVDAFDSIATLSPDVPATVADVSRCVTYAREAVQQVTKRHGERSGATLSGAVAVEVDGAPWWLVMNVGDSRVYALTGDLIEQITVDHSRVRELLDAGVITLAEANLHPERNVITRAVGDGGEGADLWLVPMRPDRAVLVVSDGLTKVFDDAQIMQMFAERTGPREQARQLVEAAVANGARDNVTVVVATSGSTITPTPDAADTAAAGITVWRGQATPVPAGMGAANDDESDDHTLLAARAQESDDQTFLAARFHQEEDQTFLATRFHQEEDQTFLAARFHQEEDQTFFAERVLPVEDKHSGAERSIQTEGKPPVTAPAADPSNEQSQPAVPTPPATPTLHSPPTPSATKPLRSAAPIQPVPRTSPVAATQPPSPTPSAAPIEPAPRTSPAAPIHPSPPTQPISPTPPSSAADAANDDLDDHTLLGRRERAVADDDDQTLLAARAVDLEDRTQLAERSASAEDQTELAQRAVGSPAASAGEAQRKRTGEDTERTLEAERTFEPDDEPPGAESPAGSPQFPWPVAELPGGQADLTQQGIDAMAHYAQARGRAGVQPMPRQASTGLATPMPIQPKTELLTPEERDVRLRRRRRNVLLGVAATSVVVALASLALVWVALWLVLWY